MNMPESSVKSILPPPFDWCEIPAGKVLLRERRSRAKASDAVHIPAFSIAKYPITNAQYRLFIDADGYTNPQWWTEESWKARLEDVRWDNTSLSIRATGIAWTEPPLWQDPRYNGAEQPVASISWYEAMAFCTWLSEASGEKVTLPTRQQWQRAAQGHDGRAYPWGRAWDADRCNNDFDGQKRKNKTGATTPVRQYEGKGDSPFGVVDMAGNVCEWCLTEYQYDPSRHMVASRSWITTGLRGYRIDDHSVYDYSEARLRGNMFGFRIVRADDL